MCILDGFQCCTAGAAESLKEKGHRVQRDGRPIKGNREAERKQVLDICVQPLPCIRDDLQHFFFTV